MSLKSLSASCSISWSEEKANTGFSATKSGPAEIAADLSIAVGATLTASRVHAKRYTIASGATEIIDLTVLENLTYDAVALTGARWLIIKSNAQPFSLVAHSSDGFKWFFDDASDKLNIKANGAFAVLDGDVTTVDATHKKIALTNTGASSGTFDVVIAGGV